MKKIIMLIFSVIYLAFAAATLLVAIELVQTAYGNPMFPSIWEPDTVLSQLMIKWEVDGILDFLAQSLVLMQVFCVILHAVCALIGKSIMTPSEEYNPKSKFRGFTLRTFLIPRIAHLFFAPVFIAHILEYIPAGNAGFGNGAFVMTCLLLGLPGLIYFLITFPRTISVIFLGKPTLGYCYCDKCNHGSFKQFKITNKDHLYDEVSTETTTTKDGHGNVKNVETRETGRRKVHRNTYSCINCDASFKKVE